ncbi:MAG: hypothetical protein K2X55_28060 [Burkholderiaceae bacterium]|nr:hypothetical protein [Burkholderiaceae bacterium]
MTKEALVVSLDTLLPRPELDALCGVLRQSIREATEVDGNVKAAAEKAAEAFAAGLAAFEKARGVEGVPVAGAVGATAGSMRPLALPRTFAEMEIDRKRAELRCLQARVAVMESALDVRESIPQAFEGVAEKSSAGSDLIAEIESLTQAVKALRQESAARANAELQAIREIKAAMAHVTPAQAALADVRLFLGLGEDSVSLGSGELCTTIGIELATIRETPGREGFWVDVNFDDHRALARHTLASLLGLILPLQEAARQNMPVDKHCLEPVIVRFSVPSPSHGINLPT